MFIDKWIFIRTCRTIATDGAPKINTYSHNNYLNIYNNKKCYCESMNVTSVHMSDYVE